jgi:hypothetical protein
MLAARAISALSMLSLAACEGPTLNAGSYLLETDASAVSDARVDKDDAADEEPGNADGDAGRVRDGGRFDGGDRRYPFEERRPCSDNRGCDGNLFNRVCNVNIPMCVECTDDQHCERFGSRFRCDEMAGFCWDRDQRPRP